MGQTDKQNNIDELLSFEIDEFGFICEVSRGRETLEEPKSKASKQQVQFKNIFSDANTADLHEKLVDHVRLTSETISYPYRCDSETHCIFLRVVVSKTSTMRVGFLNKVVGRELRPFDNILVREFVTDKADFTMCSICNRLNLDENWLEFQQLVDQNMWPANGKVMRCCFDTCANCVNAIDQRIAETRRSFDRKLK